MFSDYIIFIDESGDHSLTNINPEFPVFSLAFCIARKHDYTNFIVPAMTAFKFRWFGHDLTILHEREIVRKEGPFAFLQKTTIRNEFMSELNELMERMPMTVVAAVIDKRRLVERYRRPMNPYSLGLLFCIERSWACISREQPVQGRTHIIAEARSPRATTLGREDSDLQSAFEEILSGNLSVQNYDPPPFDFELNFAAKKTNSVGLQLADLIARPIGLSVFRPQQSNRAFEIIQSKIWRGSGLWSDGLKTYP